MTVEYSKANSHNGTQNFVLISPLHLLKLRFELLADTSRDLSLAEKKITGVKDKQIHKMTTFDY